MSSEQEAYQLLEEAEKKAKHKGWFGGNKLDEASDLYSKAGNAFKLAKKWKEAGDAFISQANILNRMNEKDEAGTAYLNASKCYRKVSPQDAIHATQLAVEILTEKGRFQTAANNQKLIAEMFETEVGDIEKAMRAYEIAADWYAGEDSKAHANACLVKVATFAAQLEQYDVAIDKFESVAAASLDNQLTKWTIREYFLKSGLCHMCTQDNHVANALDLVKTRSAIDKYQNMDVTFTETRECTFLLSLLDTVEAGDPDAFTTLVAEFDRLTKLDSWKTTLLLKIKKNISEDMDFT